jgi:predicted MFS family arabinose efflux permease
VRAGLPRRYYSLQVDDLTNKRQAWSVMLAIFLAGIIAAINSFKVPPVLSSVLSDLHVDMVTGGWLMSVSSVAGLVLAIPAALLLARLGPRITGMVALACTVTGAIVGALAPNAMTLLLGRVIEGISLSLISILAPAVISMWFEPRERGLPMGLWSAWVPIGNVIIFNTAHLLADPLGWRAVWWFGACLALGALAILSLVVTAPPQSASPQRTQPVSFGTMLLNPSTWLLALAFGTFSFSLIGFNSWAPSFLTSALHVDTASASFYASLMFLAAIPANILAGWILGRLKNRYALLPASFLITGILFFWSFRLGSMPIVVPYMIALGFVSNFIPTSAFTLAPETMPRVEFAGLALAILNMGSNLGSLTGPPILGAIFSTGQWTDGSTFLAMIIAVGTLAAWFMAQRRRPA